MSKLWKNIMYTLSGIIIFCGLMALHMYIITEDDYLVYETTDTDASIPCIEIQGALLHSETYGVDSAEIVIILHDGPGKDFRQLLPLRQLEQNYYVVFYDQRGSGLSGREDEKTLDMDQMITDLHDIITHYSESASVTIIGYSWGGILATAYAANYPHLVSNLVIVEPWDLTLPELEEQKFKEFQYAMKCWFESRHVKGPDQYAASDYYFSRLEHREDFDQAGLHYLESNDSVDQDYWRYGALANKMIMRSLLNDDEQIRLDYFDGLEKYKNEILIITNEENAGKGGIQVQLLSVCDEQTHIVQIQSAFLTDADEYIRIIPDFLDNKTLK